MSTLRRLGRSAAAVLVLVLLAGLAVTLAGSDAPAWAVGTALLALALGIALVGRSRPGPALGALVIVGALTALLSSIAHGRAGGWLVAAVVLACVAGLADDALRQRLAPGVRAVQLPGLPSDPRPQVPGPFADVLRVFLGLLGVLLIAGDLADLPEGVDLVLAAGLTVGLAVCASRLRAAVLARRRGTADRAATGALEAYAPEFYLYFSGPAEGDYQLRMWLPYLERLGVPYAILSREPRLLPRAAALTRAPVVLCERLAALDAVMVPSVRAVFYVNTHHQCVDGVRYLDRTHVHLNHGDSDKPSSYHPMIAMFDEVFVAGQAAVDRFARHGVVIPREKFVLVGRPQVADVASENLAPLPRRHTVLYAPTWRGGVRDMSFSSLAEGERIVRALLDRGVRVAFRPHPFSLREKGPAQVVARIDDLLEQAATPDCPHETSGQTSARTITECFNTSDALVADVSSVASDYLQSGKPFAVADLEAVGGQAVDTVSYPLLRAAYVLDLGGDIGVDLDAMLTSDPLEAARAELRAYYLGEDHDSASVFEARAARAIAPRRDGPSG